MHIYILNDFCKNASAKSEILPQVTGSDSVTAPPSMSAME